MKYTAEQGSAALARAKQLPTLDCVTRCYAVAMLFYGEQPVSDQAWGIIRQKLGSDAADCLSYLLGFVNAAAHVDHDLRLDVYARVAGIVGPDTAGKGAAQ